MADENDRKLTKMLSDGWMVAGYSTVMMAAGGMVHSILLQNGEKLTAYSVIFDGKGELSRGEQVLSPKSTQKRSGWF